MGDGLFFSDLCVVNVFAMGIRRTQHQPIADVAMDEWVVVLHVGICRWLGRNRWSVGHIGPWFGQ